MGPASRRWSRRSLARRRPRTATRTRPRPCCGGGSPSATSSARPTSRVANGSCEILLAAALALCEPGAEIVYAWPSFSIYPYLAPLSGAREVRVPLGDGDVHDLDAMAAEVTAATQLLIVCNPNNPTGTHLPAARIAELCERVPEHVTVIVDEAYVEFQLDDDPEDDRRPAPRRSRTSSCCGRSRKVYGLAGLRVGYALGSAAFRSAVDAVRQPFSVNAVAQAAAAEAVLHSDDVLRRVERTIVERVAVEEGVREPRAGDAGLPRQLLLDRPRQTATRRRSSPRSASSGIVVRPGTPLGGPGHIRVSYGDAAAEPALPRRPRRDALSAVTPRSRRSAGSRGCRPATRRPIPIRPCARTPSPPRRRRGPCPWHRASGSRTARPAGGET